MKLIILDRDGVINTETSTDRVVSVGQFVPIPGSLEAIAKLKYAGYIVAIATNQSIISTKLASIAELNKIHDYLQKLLMEKYQVQIDQIKICPHQEIEACYCRKPKPGMLLTIAAQYQLRFCDMQIPFVGDSVIDVLAAQAAGALPVLVKTGKGINSIIELRNAKIKNLLVFDDLLDFVNYWLSKNS